MAPSARHKELQSMTERWIKNRSFKMCGVTEANCVGYIADFVAIAGMYDAQHTRYTRHSGLKKKYMNPRYSMKKYVAPEIYPSNGDYMKSKAVFGDIGRWYVCVFEVKVSRADFLNTFNGKDTTHAKARMEPVGTAHWVVADKGVCKSEELPDFWGLLTPYGAGLTELKMPKLNVLTDSSIHAIAFDMLAWLNMNFRSETYYRIKRMTRAIRDLYAALIGEKSRSELIRLSSKALKECSK